MEMDVEEMINNIKKKIYGYNLESFPLNFDETILFFHEGILSKFSESYFDGDLSIFDVVEKEKPKNYYEELGINYFKLYNKFKEAVSKLENLKIEKEKKYIISTEINSAHITFYMGEGIDEEVLDIFKSDNEDLAYNFTNHILFLLLEKYYDDIYSDMIELVSEANKIKNGIKEILKEKKVTVDKVKIYLALGDDNI